jgi:hypothetical protein
MCEREHLAWLYIHVRFLCLIAWLLQTRAKPLACPLHGHRGTKDGSTLSCWCLSLSTRYAEVIGVCLVSYWTTTRSLNHAIRMPRGLLSHTWEGMCECLGLKAVNRLIILHGLKLLP